MNKEQKNEVASRFVSNPMDTPGAHGADRHLLEFKGYGPLCFKFSDRGGNCPGLGFYVNDGRRVWFEDRLSKVVLPKDFYLNHEQTHGKKDANGWIAFCKKGIKTQADSYADIVAPGNGVKEWRECFNVLKNAIGEFVNKNPIIHGSIVS